MKSIRDYSWEEAEDTSEEQRKKEFLGSFYMQVRRNRDPLPCGSAVREDEEPNHQRRLRLLLWVWDSPPGAGEEQEGGSGVPAHPAGGSGLHHRVRPAHLFLFLFLAVRKWWERVCITLCSSSCLELPSRVTQSSLCVDRVGGKWKEDVGLVQGHIPSLQLLLTQQTGTNDSCKNHYDWLWKEGVNMAQQSRAPAHFMFGQNPCSILVCLLSLSPPTHPPTLTWLDMPELFAGNSSWKRENLFPLLISLHLTVTCLCSCVTLTFPFMHLQTAEPEELRVINMPGHMLKQITINCCPVHCQTEHRRIIICCCWWPKMEKQ